MPVPRANTPLRHLTPEDNQLNLSQMMIQSNPEVSSIEGMSPAQKRGVSRGVSCLGAQKPVWGGNSFGSWDCGMANLFLLDFSFDVGVLVVVENEETWQFGGRLV